MILGVDVARFGDDRTVICVRQGLLLREIRTFTGLSTMDTASAVVSCYTEFSSTAVFIDAGAMGAGVIDRLRQLGYQPTEINFGAAAMDTERYANIRAEMYFKCRDWLQGGGVLTQNADLKTELASVEYKFTSNGRILLEPKDKVKERMGKSPDLADALALTFAMPVYVPHGRYYEARRRGKIRKAGSM